MKEKIGNVLCRLQNWYMMQCNNEWEKRFGIRIDTIDNPGWSVRIDLTGTNLEDEKFEDLRIDIANDNWFLVWIKDKTFQGGGAPQNLIDLINAFLTWVDQSTLSVHNSWENDDPLIKLQAWYARQCDGDWEHEYGIKIDTIDHLGWSLQVDLISTSLEGKLFKKIQRDLTENNWIRCWISDNKFQADGGPSNLSDLIQSFIDWVES